MRHEVVINRENGDVIKLITLLSSNVFIEQGYEQEQFALVKKAGEDEWVSYFPKWSPKYLTREEYMEQVRPHTLFGVVTHAECIKAGQEARKLFFK